MVFCDKPVEKLCGKKQPLLRQPIESLFSSQPINFSDRYNSSLPHKRFHSDIVINNYHDWSTVFCFPGSHTLKILCRISHCSFQRQSGRRRFEYDSDDAASETSSVCSERSYSSYGRTSEVLSLIYFFTMMPAILASKFFSLVKFLTAGGDGVLGEVKSKFTVLDC